MILKTNHTHKVLTFLVLLAMSFGLTEQLKAQGPVQPEAMQFEPVDGTDVVNLTTGDFVYSIPLMNVPGPEGGYPIVLSYHSGIGLNQPATWVGLGWTLNPGGINRVVNGAPDDYRWRTITTHYEAEKRGHGFMIGAGWGPVGVDMTFDQNMSLNGFNISIVATKETSFGKGGVSASWGTNGLSANAHSGFDIESVGSLGISAGTSGISGNAEISQNRSSKNSINNSLVSVGASLSNSGSGANFSLRSVGFSTSTTLNGRGKTEVRSFVTPKIPLGGGFWARAGFYDWKWTLNETNNDYTHGYLNQMNTIGEFARSSYERHKVKLTDGTDKGYLYPSQDIYNISGQGLSGVFMPFDNYGITLKDYNGNDNNGYIDGQKTPIDAITFRLLGEQGYNHTTINENFNWGNNYDRIDANRNFTTKIVPVYNDDQSSGNWNLLEGFIVTSPDGIRYEYFARIKTERQYSNLSSNEGSTNLESYMLLYGFSQTWLLTAIKGPDYIDRVEGNQPGFNGNLDDGDWGYWVKFNYEYLQDDVVWRAPFSGVAPGEQGAEQFTAGKRNSAYLSSIETSTHIAVFSSSYSKNGMPPTFTQNVKDKLQIPNEDFYHTLGSKKLDSLSLLNKSNLNSQLSEIHFEYDYSLRKNTPGSVADIGDGADKGTLTLKNIRNEGLNDKLVSPPYRFQYANNDLPGEGLNPNFHESDWDYWGYYRAPNAGRGLTEHYTPQIEEYANFAAAWSLTKITTPTGSSLEVEYESDDYYAVNDKTELTYRTDLPIVEDMGQEIGNQITIESGAVLEKLFIGQKIYLTLETNVDGSYNINGDVVFFTSGVKQIYEEENEIVNINLINNTVTLKNNVYLATLSSTFNTCKTDYCTWWDYYLSVIPPVSYGGGTRVKRIKTKDGLISYNTNYVYRDGKYSSGVTPSLNTPFDEDVMGVENPSNYAKINGYLPLYLNHPLSYGRPAPSVMYSKIILYNSNENGEYLSGKSEFQFYTAQDFPYHASKTTNQIIINDYSGIYGKQKLIRFYEQVNNAGELGFRKVGEKTFEYAFSDELHSNSNILNKDLQPIPSISSKPLGIIQEKHKSEVQFASGNNWLNTDIEHTRYNVFQISQTSQDYSYPDDQSLTPSSTLTTKARNIGYDMYTGQPLVTVSQTSEDEEPLISRKIPAWWKYPEMGDRNMLTQGYEATIYRSTDPDISNIDDIEDLKDYDFLNSYSDIISSEITTWSNHWRGVANDSVWRKNDSYSFIPSETYSPVPSNFNSDTTHAWHFSESETPWQMTSNVIRYDHFGHVIESVSADGSYQSVLYDSDNNSLVKAVATKARLSEIAIVDYEDYAYTQSGARTGEHYGANLDGIIATAPSGNPQSGGGYKAGVWYRTPFDDNPITLNGKSFEGTQPDEWKFARLKLSPGQDIISNDVVDFDDITIVPEYGSVSYFSYDPLTWKVTAMTGPDHRTTFYEYDDAGRLILTRDFEGNIMTKNEYGYANEIYITASVQSPDPQQQVTFTAENLDPSLNITKFDWSFGDGEGYESTSGNTVSHSYNDRQAYRLVLTTEDDNGNTRRTIQEINIGNPIEIDISHSYSNCKDGNGNSMPPGPFIDKCDITIQSTLISGAVTPVEYFWFRRPSLEDGWDPASVNNEDSFLVLTEEQRGAVYLKLKVTDDTGFVEEKEYTIQNVGQ